MDGELMRDGQNYLKWNKAIKFCYMQCLGRKKFSCTPVWSINCDRDLTLQKQNDDRIISGMQTYQSTVF